MANRTAKGRAATKVSGTTLVLSTDSEDTTTSVTLAVGDSLDIGIINNGINPPDTVKWGLRKLEKVGQRTDSVNGFTVSAWAMTEVQNEGIRDIIVTWGAEITSRAMVISSLDSPHIRDEIARNLDAASTAPSVGPTAEHLRRDDFCFGYLGAEGPDNDTPPAVATMSTGQVAGTAGLPAAGNVTIHEFYLQSTTSGGVTLSGTGASDARNWCNILIAFKVAQDYCVDKWGSAIEVGYTVTYLPDTSADTVTAVNPSRNTVTLATAGRVSAVECEVTG